MDPQPHHAAHLPLAPSAHDAWLSRLSADLTQRRAENLARDLRPIDGPQGPTLIIQGQQYIQFCTNNYIGLADDPEVVDAARTALGRFGMGAGASRLVAGSMDLHHQLETQLALFKNTPAALVFSTGYMANLAALTTFAGPRDRIVSDKLNHASLLDAARFSGASHRTFPHRNYPRAAALLEPSPSSDNPQTTFLVSDSVFSMDGDLADLPTLAALAHSHHALLLIDEAHATGVLGPHGRGLAELQNVPHGPNGITLTIGTLSKALGSIGGFIAGPQEAIDTLINSARSFMYTTALPPVCSAASLAALQIIQRDPARRTRVLALAAYVKKELTAMGYNCGDSATPIIPVMIGPPAAALQASEFLRTRGLFVPAIRPPTVPPNTARLRLSLMTTHTDAHIETLLTAMRQLASILPLRLNQ